MFFMEEKKLHVQYLKSMEIHRSMNT